MLSKLPFLTTEQMRAVDEAMIEFYHIELVQMMENAGRNLAALARSRFLAGDPRGKEVLLLAGRGGNGGGGLVCARRLHNWGAGVQVLTAYPAEDYQGVPAHQLDILQRMEVPLFLASQFDWAASAPAVIIDALIGYGLTGSPRGAAAEMIRAANRKTAPILSLDVPSGLDAASGESYPPTIRAQATLTLALPKEGLRAAAAAFVGELYLADISVPPALYARLGIKVDSLFAQRDIIRIKN